MCLACETYLVTLQALSFAMCKRVCVILGASLFPRSQREELLPFYFIPNIPFRMSS